jgi:ATP-dependent helicase YprA (DUF1998 family)
LGIFNPELLHLNPQDRRRIERDAFSGQLLGIVSTNALELGVDIGVLDAVIMLGFPMTIASFVIVFHVYRKIELTSEVLM